MTLFACYLFYAEWLARAVDYLTRNHGPAFLALEPDERENVQVSAGPAGVDAIRSPSKIVDPLSLVTLYGPLVLQPREADK